MDSKDKPLSLHAALSGKRVLLTGATGFLAKVVLEKLIRAVPEMAGVVLLIRPGENGDASERFEREIAASSVFDTLRAREPAMLERFFDDQLECVAADLTQPLLGLSVPARAILAGRIDVVIHVAASVNFREPLDAALAINAHSVSHVAALAKLADAPLVHVSTCYVNGYNTGDMHEKLVHPKRKDVAWDLRGFYDVRQLLADLQEKIDVVAKATPDAELRRTCLTELGIAEANRHGWNDTYTFTKWIGEQLALSSMFGRGVTIVRPSIIESALQEPAQGWIEGVKVGDAIILAYARGKTRYFPGRDDVIDIIPVDLVANTILLAAAEALQDPALPRIYQACTGSSNPVTLGRVIELIKDEAKRNWHWHDRLFHRAPEHDFELVSGPAFLYMLRLQRLAVGARNMLRRCLGLQVDAKAADAVRTTETLARTFSFYTAPCYRFQNARVQELARRFPISEQLQFAVDTGLIDWRDYLCRIHLAGLNRYALRPRKAQAEAAEVPQLQVGGAIGMPAQRQLAR
jgi:fatty acyl-CoA reductase